MPVLQITNEARDFLTRWVCGNYKIDPDQMKAWCQGLADRAAPPTDGSFDFTKLWTEAGEVASNPDEVHIFKAAAEVGWELYQSIRHRIGNRQKGTQMLAASEVFSGLDGAVPVEVLALYEVDPKNGTVAFLFFDTFTPAPAELVNAAERAVWR